MFEARLLEGRKVGEKIRQELLQEIEGIRIAKREIPKLAGVVVGNHPASESYLKAQEKAAGSLGMLFEKIDFDENVDSRELISKIQELNGLREVHGIIIQLPLPERIHVNELYAVLDPKKDVEGVHSSNLGLLVLKKEKLAPCTALAAMEMILSTGVALEGTEAVIVGASRIVGRPIDLLLQERNCTTTVCNIETEKRGTLERHVRRAEILVVAVGKPELVPGRWVKDGAVVIDIGVNRKGDRLVGDVGFEEARKRASFITPVPGGIGPLTVMMLMKNLLTAYQWQKGEI